MLPTSFGVETACVVPSRFSVISPRSTGLSASLMLRLILVFRTRHRWILVVAALFPLGFLLLGVFVECVHGSGIIRMARRGKGVQGHLDFLDQG